MNRSANPFDYVRNQHYRALVKRAMDLADSDPSEAIRMLSQAVSSLLDERSPMRGLAKRG